MTIRRRPARDGAPMAPTATGGKASEHQKERTFPGMGIAALHRRPDAEVARRIREPEAAVREAPAGPLRDRGDRSHEEPAPREGARDHRHPDPGAQAAGPDPQDHR